MLRRLWQLLATHARDFGIALAGIIAAVFVLRRSRRPGDPLLPVETARKVIDLERQRQVAVAEARVKNELSRELNEEHRAQLQSALDEKDEEERGRRLIEVGETLTTESEK